MIKINDIVGTDIAVQVDTCAAVYWFHYSVSYIKHISGVTNLTDKNEVKGVAVFITACWGRTGSSQKNYNF